MNGVIFQIGENEIRLPLSKKLSKDEKNYLRVLNNGIDNVIQYTIKWLDTSEADNLLNVDEDEFIDEFVSSNLYSNLNSIFLENSNNGKKLISRFYKIGSKLGYDDIGHILPVMPSDNKALNILTNHVGDVVINVNVECGIGIQDELLLGAMNNVERDKLKENILMVPFVPIRNVLNVTSRCGLIARTEYGRAINTGVLQAYSNSGVNQVNINTTGLPNVCDDCLLLESNNPYSLEEAMQLLPLHPQCACSYSPVHDSIENNEDVVVIDLT